MEDGCENGSGNEVPFFHRAISKGDYTQFVVLPYCLSVKSPKCFKTGLPDATMRWSSGHHYLACLCVGRTHITQRMQMRTLVIGHCSARFPLRVIYSRTNLQTLVSVLRKRVEHFGVSHEIVRKVLRALCRREGMPMPPAKDSRGRSRFKV